MRLVAEILIRHVAWITAERYLAHRIDAEEWNHRPGRVAANLLLRHQPLAGDDQSLRRPGEVGVRDGGASNPAVAETIRLMHVNRRHVRKKGRDGCQRLAGERTGDRPGGAAGERVGAQ